MTSSNVVIEVSGGVAYVEATGKVNVIIVEWDDGKLYTVNPVSKEKFNCQIDRLISNLKEINPAPSEYDGGFTEESRKQAIAFLNKLKEE